MLFRLDTAVLRPRKLTGPWQFWLDAGLRSRIISYTWVNRIWTLISQWVSQKYLHYHKHGGHWPVNWSAPVCFLNYLSFFLSNLVEIRLPKKFSVCVSVLISSQALSKVFWKFKILPWCIPMHILAWTHCVIPSVDKLWYIDTFSSSNL